MSVESATIDNLTSKFSSLVEQGRGLFSNDPYIFYLIGYVVALYLTFFFIYFYIGPLIFGNRYALRRSIDISGLPPQHNMMVVDPINASALTEKVHSALENHNHNYGA